MVHIEVNLANKEALLILKERLAFKKMNDVVTLLLETHESDALNKGKQIAELAEKQQKIRED